MIPDFPGSSEPSISFFSEAGGMELPDLQQQQLTSWITQVIEQRNGQLGELNYILCGDDYLHRINVEYLDHDTLTDIITFPMHPPPLVAGDVFISTERVAENARELQQDFATELRRVIIHGVLHLCGQGDKTPAEAAEMRRQEAWALSLISAS